MSKIAKSPSKTIIELKRKIRQLEKKLLRAEESYQFIWNRLLNAAISSKKGLK